MELIFLTLILGATVLLAFYITKIFKSEVFVALNKWCKWSTQAIQVKEEMIEVTDEAEVKSSPPPAPGPAATKSKKKPEKKAKEKDSFKHPWLVTSLKVHNRPLLCVLKTYFRVTVGVLWTLTSAPMEGTWPHVLRIRLLWFGAPSNWNWVVFGNNYSWGIKSYSPLVHYNSLHPNFREFSAREHKPLRCNVEFDHGLFVK